MKITYCNSEDDLTFLLNKDVILHCSRDSVSYAGKIVIEHHWLGYDYLVFIGISPQNCEIKACNKFDVDISQFKTAMYVGDGRKEFDFAIRYSEDLLFKKEWDETFKQNMKEYDARVKKRREGENCF